MAAHKLVLNVMTRVGKVGLILGFFCTGVMAQTIKGSVAPYSPYAVDGLAVGGSVAPQSRVYKSYQCEPSIDYPGYTWCKRTQTKRSGSKDVSVSTSIVHGSDNVVAYINQTVRPAKFSSGDIQNELVRLSKKFHSPPQVRNLTERSGSVGATLAIWGGIHLQPLGSDDLSVVAQGKSPHRGILVDLLGDMHKSAGANLPVYSVSGEQGFVWMASYDREGEGTLRFFAMDPSLLNRASPSGDSIAREQYRPQAGLESIAMAKEGGVFVVPVRFNDMITLKAIVDSGASDVSVPADVVSTLIRTGTITSDDFLGEQTYVLADGSKVPSARFRIRSLKVGGKTVENVTAAIASGEAQILLGQSFLSRFKSWSVDNQSHVLRLE
jgi:clan AA aspartic protease (TIGR02281 family)